MGTTGVFSSLLAKLGETPHDFRPSLSTFAQIDNDSLKRQLNLEQRAKERGERNEPPSSSKILDEVETDVVECIEAEKSLSRQTFSDQLQIYAGRIGNLNFRGKQGEIAHHIREARVEFNKAIVEGLDELHKRRRHLLEVEGYLKTFRSKNQLDRVCKRPSDSLRFILAGLVVTVGLVETLGNSSFLAKGNQLGWIGAFSESAIISFVNLGFAFFCARMAININHIDKARKAGGFAAILGFLLIALFFNLLVAHYREVTGTLLDAGGRLALAAFYENPFGMLEFQSWILFGMGFLFALISFADGIKWDDPYPDFGNLYAKVAGARDEYTSEKEHHNSQLEDIFRAASNEIRGTKKEIGQLRNESSEILEGRARMKDSFVDHLGHLERSGNSLLSFYRERNRQYRTEKSPTYFSKKWEMDRPSIEIVPSSDELSNERIDELLAAAETEMNEGLAELEDRFNEGLRQFRKLDELVDDGFDPEVKDEL